jgi:hypothetical protein
MNRIELFSTIKKNKPNISESSAKVYTTTLAALGQTLGWSNPNFFSTKFKDVVAHLNTLPCQRAKQICSSLIAYTKDKKALKAYKEYILLAAEACRKNVEKQEKSEAQEENWESWADIMKTYEQLKKEAYPLFSKENLTSANLKTLRDFVILSFYVLIPPRRIKDYIDFKIKNINKEKDNYWDKEKHELVFNSYKTAKNYGQQRVDAPKELEEIFELWIPIAEEFSDYMLFNGYGEKMAQPVLTKAINQIFGKKISASMLRHIYISDVVLKDVPRIEKLDEIAHDMGQSRNQQMLYKKF